MIYPDYSILLRKARENSGLTQKELSERLSFSSQTLSLWEIGKSAMKIDVMFEVCKILKVDPIDFENGELSPRRQERTIDLNKLLKYIKAKVNQRKIPKKQLGEELNVSSPTLRKILKGEVVVDVVQFFLMSVALNFSIEEALTTSSNKDILEPLRKKKGLLPVLCGAAVLCLGVIGIGIYHISRKEIPDIANNQMQKEETPVLIIDYKSKKVEGFEPNHPYSINEEEITPVSTYVEIRDAWIDKEIKIKKKARNESYLDSDEFVITIESSKFLKKGLEQSRPFMFYLNTIR